MQLVQKLPRKEGEILHRALKQRWASDEIRLLPSPFERSFFIDVVFVSHLKWHEMIGYCNGVADSLQWPLTIQIVKQ